jgi:alpha-tubulin suppressor-like RCC1 family protein
LVQITAGNAFACALSAAGAAYCWGRNAEGELGNNSTASSSVPVAVTTSGVLAGTVLSQISAGSSSACALSSTGAASCWGGNGSGQLGNSSTASSSVPVAVSTSGVLAGKTLTQVSVGTSFACALDYTGTAYCWGHNGEGELGINTTADSHVPAAVSTSGVLSGKIVTQVSAGGTATCALDTGGAAYCWGDNADGDLGNNSTAESNVPVTVSTSGVLSGKTLIQATAGITFACALDTGGAAYCWGDNSSGQLGNGSTSSSGVPVPVTAQAILPGAPTGVTAKPGNTTATISWTAPSSFGSGTLTGYTATASPGSASCSTGGATTCTITGLTNGTAYTVTVITHATGGDSPPSSPVTVTPTGMLAIAVPSVATLPGPAPGGTASAQLGTVTVTDTRGLATASWMVMVTATAFSTGSGTGPQTIPPSHISYWSGPATATTGTGTFTPGQLNAASAVNLSAARTAFSLTGGSGSNSASWNATVSVAVPASAVAGTYTATITHSVA